MPVQLTVRAEVVDIQTDAPKPRDRFFVDTNVWFWQTYSNASRSTKLNTARINDYSNYLTAVLISGASLNYSGLVLAELTHIIERTEREIYNLAHRSLNQKEYRHNLAAERRNVVAEVQSAWAQVRAIATCLPLTIDDLTTQAALTRFQTQAVDGYDLLMLETASRQGLIQFITDDMDYVTVPGIQVFTLNTTSLQAALQQGRILVRPTP